MMGLCHMVFFLSVEAERGLAPAHLQLRENFSFLNQRPRQILQKYESQGTNYSHDYLKQLPFQTDTKDLAILAFQIC
jgi:hypothetical protein